MLHCTVFGIQNDKKDVGNKSLNLRFEQRSKVSNEGNKESQTQFNNCSVCTGSIFEKTGAKVLTNGVVELRSGVEDGGC